MLVAICFRWKIARARVRSAPIPADLTRFLWASRPSSLWPCGCAGTDFAQSERSGKNADDGTIQAQEVKGAASGGWHASDGDMPEPSSEAAMLTIAETITRTTRAAQPGLPIRGSLLVHELTREGFRMTSQLIQVDIPQAAAGAE